MMVRSRGGLLASSLAALALNVAVTGCGNQTSDADLALARPSTHQGASESPVVESPEESPQESPQESPRDEEAAPGSEESDSPAEDESPDATPRARGIRGKLLTAEEVPGFNEEFSWAVKSTRMREGRQPFGTCHKFAMTSIGAEKVVLRSYAPKLESAGSTASQLVAEFADEMTAKRAFEVLRSWAGKCGEELANYDHSEVGKLKPVPVNAGTAVGNWYLLTYGPTKSDPDAGYFDAQGLTRVGSTISALQMRLVGQDYNYPSGEEPMVAAVQHAAARIG